MSHTVTTKTVCIKNLQTLQKAIEALKASGMEVSLPNGLTPKKVDLFENKVDGVAVKLPNWSYPVVVNTETGNLHYDNYNGQWGKQIELDKLLQEYVRQEAIENYQEMGYYVDEYATQYDSNGNLHLELINPDEGGF